MRVCALLKCPVGCEERDDTLEWLKCKKVIWKFEHLQSVFGQSDVGIIATESQSRVQC